MVDPKRMGSIEAALRARSLAGQDPAPAQSGTKQKVKVTRVENGHEIEEWIEVDTSAGPAWPARADLRLLNHDLPRVDGPEKVRGTAIYTHDVRLPGMLYARLLLCPHPTAKVVELDLAPALALAGVVDAIALQTESTSYLGQPVAAVAAETLEAAEDGLRAIRVRYERLPFAIDAQSAQADGAPAVGRKGNISGQRQRGEAAKTAQALAGADAVVEATYEVPVQHHVCLETHGAVVDYRGSDSATVYASTQGTFTIRDEAAEILGLQGSQVQSVVQHMGGGFGSKFGLGIEGRSACEFAKRLKRPVHLMLTRRDEFLIAGNRSGAVQKMKAGAKRDGSLVALQADVTRLGGLGQGSHPGHPYIYSVGVSSLDSRSVLTHTDASRAMRAPGHPQASFAIESILDELAYAIHMDPLSFRIKNLTDTVYHRQLERCAREIGWYEHPHRTEPGPSSAQRGLGIGFAIATWGGGGGPECEVEVRIDPSGGVRVFSGTQDLGTGVRTYVTAIVAEALGREMHEVKANIGHSDYGQANASGGSVTTASLAPAVMDAAFQARKQFFARLAPTLGTQVELLLIDKGEVVDRGASGRRLSWKQACALLASQEVSGKGTWQAGLADNGVHGAQAAKVEVELDTGRVRVLEMVGVQDCGLPLNRMALRSQLQGGMIQALSYALLEERVLDPWLGLALSDNLESYKVANMLEMPTFKALIDDEDTRTGVIGMAEPAIIPGHSAIANAVHNACGARVRSLPLSPDKVLAALAVARKLGGGK